MLIGLVAGSRPDESTGNRAIDRRIAVLHSTNTCRLHVPSVTSVTLFQQISHILACRLNNNNNNNNSNNETLVERSAVAYLLAIQSTCTHISWFVSKSIQSSFISNQCDVPGWSGQSCVTWCLAESTHLVHWNRLPRIDLTIATCHLLLCGCSLTFYWNIADPERDDAITRWRFTHLTIH